MLVAILQHTPIWVYILLIVLIIVGIQQSRTRQVSRTRLLILPLAMTALSLYGVLAAFGVHWLPLLCWLCGLTLTTLLVQRLLLGRIQYCTTTGRFTQPGSWLPLTLMMGIFLMKYCVGATLAMAPDIVKESAFIVSVATLNGVFSGLFLARLCKLRKPPQPDTKKPA